MSNNNDEKPNDPVLRDYTEVVDLDYTSHEGNPKVVESATCPTRDRRLAFK